MAAKTYDEVSRRQYAAATVVARRYRKTMDELLAIPQLCAFATSVFIRCEQLGIELPATAWLGDRLAHVNGYGKRSAERPDYFEVAKQLVTKGA